MRMVNRKKMILGLNVAPCIIATVNMIMAGSREKEKQSQVESFNSFETLYEVKTQACQILIHIYSLSVYVKLL